MRSFGSLHEASILSVLLLSKEIGHYLVAISPPSALVARPMAAVIGFLPCDRSVAARPELPTDVGHETKDPMRVDSGLLSEAEWSCSTHPLGDDDAGS